jgi:preprotein translocase subunit SecA
LLEVTDVTELMDSLRHGVFHDVVRTYVPAESVEEQWDIPALERVLASDWNIHLPLTQMVKDEPNLSDEEILSAWLP